MQDIPILENQTTNTTTAWIKPPPGIYTIYFLGALGGATLTMKFSHNHADANPDSPDFTFTAEPAPFQFRLPDGFSVAADLASAGASTDVTFGIKRDYVK